MTKPSPTTETEQLKVRTNLELATIDLITQATEDPDFELHPAIRERDPNLVATSLIWANKVLKRADADKLGPSFDAIPINFIDAATTLFISHQENPLDYSDVEIGLTANLSEHNFLTGYTITTEKVFNCGAQRLALHIMRMALSSESHHQQPSEALIQVAHMIAEIPIGPKLFLEDIFESDWFKTKGLHELMNIFLSINDSYHLWSNPDENDLDNLQRLVANMWVRVLKEAETDGHHIQEILERTLMLLHSRPVMDSSIIRLIPTDPEALNNRFLGAVTNYWHVSRNGSPHVQKTAAGGTVVREAKNLASREL